MLDYLVYLNVSRLLRLRLPQRLIYIDLGIS